MMRLSSYRSVFGLVSKFFRDPRLRDGVQLPSAA